MENVPYFVRSCFVTAANITIPVEQIIEADKAIRRPYTSVVAAITIRRIPIHNVCSEK